MMWLELIKLREEAGLSQKEMAEKLKVTEIYYASLERPPRKRTKLLIPSARMIRRIAQIVGKNENMREEIEKKLFIIRQKHLAPKGLKEFFLEKTNAYSLGSMPQEFIDRVKEDIKKFEPLNDDFYNRIGITHEVLENILAGKYAPTRELVVSIATGLKQPIAEYLILAGYIPDSIRETFTSPYGRIFFRKLGDLSPQDVVKVITILVQLLDTMKWEGK